MKKYDEERPFRLAITVFRNDAKGEIVRRMANGTVIGYATSQEAMKELFEFIRVCENIPSEFATYGVAFVVDEQSGEVISWRTIS